MWLLLGNVAPAVEGNKRILTSFWGRDNLRWAFSAFADSGALEIVQ